MPSLFEELDYQPTPMGAISLRRRSIPALGEEPIYEVRLGDEWLMSSLFTTVEVALAEIGLAALGEDAAGLRVVVGGLGLGYTARAALDSGRVAELTVVEALAPVVGWHESGLVPLGRGLSEDPRCRFLLGDFFALAGGEGFGGAGWDAVLLDIDHSPDKLLAPGHAAFYSEGGLAALACHLRPGGVFAMWSDDPPEAGFTALLEGAFAEVGSHLVAFDNPLRGGRSESTVYLARRAAGEGVGG